MSLLQELYRKPVEDFQPEPDERLARSHIHVDGNFSFMHDLSHADFFKQMLSMPQFNGILEKKFTLAFESALWEFKSTHRQDRVNGLDWTEAPEGETNTTFKGTKEEHMR